MAAWPWMAAALLALLPAAFGVRLQSLQTPGQREKALSPEKIAQLETDWRAKHNITTPPPEDGKPHKRRHGKNSTPKVLIYQANRKDAPVMEYMYEPFVQTLRDGFEHAEGWSVAVPAPVMEYKYAMEAALPTLGAGDIFVFVGGIGKGTFLDVMYEYFNATNATSLASDANLASAISRDQAGGQSLASAMVFRDHAERYNFSALRARGVLVVYYQTDAAYECALTSADPVDEMWDFSWHNIDVCKEQGNGPATIRYVPPGWLSDSPLVPQRDDAGSLMHMGHAWWRVCWLKLYNMLPGELAFESSAWTDDAFKGLLKHHNVFLNLHKGECGWSRNPLAAARVSRIVSAKALIISELAYPKDMAEYEGIVTFVDWSQIPSAYARIRDTPAAERRAMADNAYSLLKTKFAPAALFQNADIYSMMELRT